MRHESAALRADVELFTKILTTRQESIIPSPETLRLARDSPVQLQIKTGQDAWRAVTLLQHVCRLSGLYCIPPQIITFLSLRIPHGSKPPRCSKISPNKVLPPPVHLSGHTRRTMNYSGGSCGHSRPSWSLTARCSGMRLRSSVTASTIARGSSVTA